MPDQKRKMDNLLNFTTKFNLNPLEKNEKKISIYTLQRNILKFLDNGIQIYTTFLERFHLLF